MQGDKIENKKKRLTACRKIKWINTNKKGKYTLIKKQEMFERKKRLNI